MRAELRKLIETYPRQQRFALAIMQDIQREFNHIPREGLEDLSRHINCPLSHLYAMATFYRALSLKPKGKHIIRLCDGTACHIKGSFNLISGVKRVLNLLPGETTPDGLFSLELVNCLGSCAIAPVLVVDGTYYGKVTSEKLKTIIAEYRQGGVTP